MYNLTVVLGPESPEMPQNLKKKLKYFGPDGFAQESKPLISPRSKPCSEYGWSRCPNDNLLPTLPTQDRNEDQERNES